MFSLLQTCYVFIFLSIWQKLIEGENEFFTDVHSELKFISSHLVNSSWPVNSITSSLGTAADSYNHATVTPQLFQPDLKVSSSAAPNLSLYYSKEDKFTNKHINQMLSPTATSEELNRTDEMGIFTESDTSSVNSTITNILVNVIHSKFTSPLIENLKSKQLQSNKSISDFRSELFLKEAVSSTFDIMSTLKVNLTDEFVLSKITSNTHESLLPSSVVMSSFEKIDLSSSFYISSSSLPVKNNESSKHDMEEPLQNFIKNSLDVLYPYSSATLINKTDFLSPTVALQYKEATVVSELLIKVNNNEDSKKGLPISRYRKINDQEIMNTILSNETLKNEVNKYPLINSELLKAIKARDKIKNNASVMNSNCSMEPVSMTHEFFIKFKVMSDSIKRQDLPAVFEERLRNYFNESSCISIMRTSFIDGPPSVFSWTNHSVNTVKCDKNSIEETLSRMFRRNGLLRFDLIDIFAPNFKILDIKIEYSGLCKVYTRQFNILVIVASTLFVLGMLPCIIILTFKICKWKRLCHKFECNETLTLKAHYPVIFPSEVSQKTTNCTNFSNTFSNPTFQEDSIVSDNQPPSYNCKIAKDITPEAITIEQNSSTCATI